MLPRARGIWKHSWERPQRLWEHVKKRNLSKKPEFLFKCLALDPSKTNYEYGVGECISVPISLEAVMPTKLPPFNSAWGGRKGLVYGHRENFCLQGCQTSLHPEDYCNFLIKAKFVGSLLFWCGSCSWKTGPCLRLYCMPMAQQPATHISEPTPHKQPRSCFFTAGCVRGAWDHHDMEGPPLLIVSWGLDHLRVPHGIVVVFWDGRGVDKVTYGDSWQSFCSWPCCSPIPREEQCKEEHSAKMILQHHHIRMYVSGPAGPEEGPGPVSVILSHRPTYSRLVLSCNRTENCVSWESDGLSEFWTWCSIYIQHSFIEPPLYMRHLSQALKIHQWIVPLPSQSSYSDRSEVYDITRMLPYHPVNQWQNWDKNLGLLAPMRALQTFPLRNPHRVSGGTVQGSLI